MNGDDEVANGRSAVAHGWGPRLASGLIGIATGEIVSSVTGLLGSHGSLYVAAGALVVAAMVKLRDLPRRSPLVRYSGSVLLLLSMASAVAATLGPASWRLPAVFASVGVLALALIVFDPASAFRLLIGASWIGFGLACVAGAIGFFVDHRLLVGLAASAYGLMFLLTAFAIMAEGAERVLAEILTITAGTWLNVTGLNLLFHGGIGSKVLALPILAAGAGLWFLGRFSEVSGDYFVEETIRAMFAATAVCLVSGVVLLVRGQLILGVAGLYLGVGLAGIALVWMGLRPTVLLRRWYLKAVREPE
jgi:hypothetical protein